MIKNQDKVTRKDVQTILKISTSTTGRLLDEKETNGLVEQVGQYKDTYYIIKSSWLAPSTSYIQNLILMVYQQMF